jgi:pimeloyl-ACP methyl ester carboxylesterase
MIPTLAAAGYRAIAVVTLNDLPTNEPARAVFDAWEKPLLTLFGRLDGNLGSEAVQAEMRDTVPGAQGQPHHAYDDAHHFIQEDKGEDLARRVVDFMRDNPVDQSLPDDGEEPAPLTWSTR